MLDIGRLSPAGVKTVHSGISLPGTLALLYIRPIVFVFHILKEGTEIRERKGEESENSTIGLSQMSQLMLSQMFIPNLDSILDFVTNPKSGPESLRYRSVSVNLSQELSPLSLSIQESYNTLTQGVILKSI